MDAEQIAHACFQFISAKWFGDKIVRTQIEAFHFAGFIGACGEQYDPAAASPTR